jgi:hypothetical protein
MAQLFRGRVAPRLGAGAALLSLVLGLLLPGSLAAHPQPTAPAAQGDQQCFAQTGLCIAGRLRQFWQENGGVEVFGYPTSDQHQEVIENRPVQVQWFERNRLELHPENARPYDVLLGRLGVDRLGQQGRAVTGFGKAAAVANCEVFTQTGHTLCAPFGGYFHSHGLQFDGAGGYSAAESLALFGLPLSEPAMETNSSGDTVLTQWFERARFEFHPGNPALFQVQLGLLGSEVHGGAAPAAAPPPAANTGALPGDWLGRFNAYRTAAGLAPVPDDPALSAAAAKHISYMMQNPDEFKHDETPGLPGYTAEGQQAAKESNLFRSSPGFSAADAIDGWMDSLYHRFGMLNAALTRTGFALNCDGRGCAAALNVLGGTEGQPRPGGVVYPGDGQQGVTTAFISWQFGPFEAPLQLTGATLRDGAGNAVPFTTTSADGYWNIVSVKPSSPFAANTTYTVEITATQNGQALHKAWSFHTK